MKKIYVVLVLLALLAYGWWYVTPHYSPELEPQKATNEVPYICSEGKTVNIKFSQGGESGQIDADGRPVPTGSAEISLSDGRILNLPQTISASGVRYSSEDESFVFWSKGNSALVLEDGKEESYVGCIASPTESADLGKNTVYSNAAQGFAVRIPEGYEINEGYSQELSSGQVIEGVRFTVPESMTAGTNLSPDTSIMIEGIVGAEVCSADQFMEFTNGDNQSFVEGDIQYSVATSSDAAAGNRYEETVYAFPGTSPCLGIRYFIHYGVIENYPEGAVNEFDINALMDEFDLIRKTLIQA